MKLLENQVIVTFMLFESIRINEKIVEIKDQEIIEIIMKDIINKILKNT